MSYRHDLATNFALLKVIGAELAVAKKTADGEIRDTWHPGDRNSASLPSGSLLGAVTLAKGRTLAKLSDEDAYRAWVERTHPGEIETVTRVRPDFTERLMSAARQLGQPVDAATGEEVPGISVEQGEPYPTVRLAPDAKASVALAWQDGGLTEVVGSLLRPALEGGE